MSRKREDPFLLLLLLAKKGPMNAREMEACLFQFVSQFGFWDHQDGPHQREDHRDFLDVSKACDSLLQKGLVTRDEQGVFHLSESGRGVASGQVQKLEKASRWMHNNVFSAEATSRNTVIIDCILAFFKLLAGFLSGSAGLIADGTDAAIDMLSAGVVLWTVKRKKELLGALVIVTLMFATSVGIGVDCALGIVSFVRGQGEVMDHVVLVIVVESVALLAAWLLSFYQKLVGKRQKNLALLSQSVDSKNHIYVSLAVIVGAIFAQLGVSLVDTLIAGYIAVRIFRDAVSLLRETVGAMRGEEVDFSRYETGLERKWKVFRDDSFQAWVLFCLLEAGTQTKEQLVCSLREHFQPEYVPLLSEFRFQTASHIDFSAHLDTLLEPLQRAAVVEVKEDGVSIPEAEREKLVQFCAGFFREAIEVDALRGSLERLPGAREWKGEHSLRNLSEDLEDSEKVLSIAKGKADSGILMCVVTDRRIVLRTHLGKTRQSFAHSSLQEVKVVPGSFSTFSLEFVLPQERIRLGYISSRKGVGLLRALHSLGLIRDGAMDFLSGEGVYDRLMHLARIVEYVRGKTDGE